MVREHLHIVHTKRSAPALLREWEIHADGDDIHAGKARCGLIELLGLRVANGRVQRRDYADDAHVVSSVLQTHGLQCPVGCGEIGSRVAGLQFGSDQSQGVALESGCSWSFHRFSWRLKWG